MVARWAFAPVTGFDYWRVILFSPEVLIFLFFMITDPKTVPASRRGRIVFGFLVAVASTLLMAPQTKEFGTKVALLGGLVVVCACRPILDRLVPAQGSTHPAGPRHLVVRAGSLARGRLARNGHRCRRRARSWQRRTRRRRCARAACRTKSTRRPSRRSPSNKTWSTGTTRSPAPERAEIVLTLAENLELESQAARRADPTILEAVDHGDRLDEMRAQLQADAANDTRVVERYRIDDVNVTLLAPFGRQEGLSLGLESRGTMTTETYNEAGHLQDRTSTPFAKTFVIRRATGQRWLNVAVLPINEKR